MRKEYIDSISKEFEESYEKLIALLAYSISDRKNFKEILQRVDLTIDWARTLSAAETYDIVKES